MLEIDMIARCLKRVLNTQLRDLMRRMRTSRHRDITERAIVRSVRALVFEREARELKSPHFLLKL